MGARADKVTLDQVKFDLISDKYPKEIFNVDDPDKVRLQTLYCNCYATVFDGVVPDKNDNAERFSAKILANANAADCSLRMFMLSNMIAHETHEKQVIKHTEKLRASRFTARSLTSAYAIKRAQMYQQMCRDRFGVFSVKSLAALSDDKETMTDTEQLMLQNEVMAGTWMVRHKIFNSGPSERLMFDTLEFQLSHEWLALESSYTRYVLTPMRLGELKSTKVQEYRRKEVLDLIGFLKRNPSKGRWYWTTRQAIMAKAVTQVLAKFNLQPCDFMYSREPVTDVMSFWRTLGLTVRHYHCLLYLNGENNLFTPRHLRWEHRS
jgi:hypothetical protein